MSFPFAYLSQYADYLKEDVALVTNLKSGFDLVGRYDDATLPIVCGTASSLRTLALLCLKVSFVSLLSDKECIQFKDEMANVNGDVAQGLLELAEVLKTTSLCDGDFATRLMNSPLFSAPKPDLDFAIAIVQLALRTEVLLSSGGDDRLNLGVNKGRVNKYFCSTLPRPTVLRRGSCTCSTTTLAQFAIADKNRIAMIAKALKLAEKLSANECMDGALEINDDIRFRLGKSLGMDDTDPNSHKIILFPSGSDAELLPVYVALTRAKKVFNFVTAAGEVGSGTPNASNMRHFSVQKTMGGKQENNGPIFGYDGSSVEVIQFKPRKSDGSTDFREDEIASAIDEKLSSASDSIAILHMVLGSKTGLISPTQSFIDSIRAKHGSRLILVADACQLRCTAAYIKSIVDDGIICLITGSKFFSGPPFSGAVILPVGMGQELEKTMSSPNCSLPKGLDDYLTPYDVTKGLPVLRKFLKRSGSDRPVWYNPGLSLRWLCGVEAIEGFFSMPPNVVDSFTKKWVHHTKSLVKKFSPYLEILDVALGVEGSFMMGNSNTIVSVIPNILDGDGMRRLNEAECKVYHQLMGKDCSDLFEANSDEKEILEKVAMLGQTVKLSGSLSIVRIALGADMVNEALAACRSNPVDEMQMAFDISRVLDIDRIVVQKMYLLAKLWTFRTMKVESLKAIDMIFEKAGEKINATEIAPVASIDRLSSSLQSLRNVPNTVLMYDLDAFDSSINLLKTGFNSATNSLGDENFLHCFAMKSCPVSYILHRCINNGLGLECASIVEVQQALRCGCPPNRIVFDSPIKTKEEVEFAILNGVNLNANSWSEVDKIKSCVKGMTGSAKGVIGVRVNPLIGAGTIAELSVATASSKFGIPLTDENKLRIVKLFQEFPYMQGIMCHVGSQGMAVEKLVDGAKVVYDLANLVDDACKEDRIKMLDIGGGLSANYDTDELKPSFAYLASRINDLIPDFFATNKEKKRVIATEFGKSLVTKCAIVAAKVEDTLKTVEVPQKITAIIHTGADLFLRTAYCPDKFSHRVAIADSNYMLKKGNETNVNVVGPLCFSGDVIAKNIQLSAPTVGDNVLILDAGANTISLYSRHCSRLAPPVYGYRGGEGWVKAVCIKASETPDDVMSFWG
jgi:diaminopimelate decarboxylase